MAETIEQAVLPELSVKKMLDIADKPKTLSILIVDQSGSMEKHGLVPQDCVNNHFRELQYPPDGREQFCTVILFANKYRVATPLTPALELQPMTSYKADGGTLLFETVHQVMKLFLSVFQQKQTNLKVVVGVFSDGDDNESDPTRQPTKVQDTAKRAKHLGWDLYSFGIGIDGQRLAELLGFPADDVHAKTFTANTEGIRKATRDFSRSTTTVGFADHFDPGAK